MTAPIQFFTANSAGRDYVVGDIHGCFDVLDTLLERLAFDRARDRLFSVGDLIDRGPQSARAREFIDAPWFHAIRGNHEQMMLDAVADLADAQLFWYMNGGDWFESLDAAQRAAMVERAARLPYVIEVAIDAHQRAGLIHAQMPDMSWAALGAALQDEPIDAELAEILLWDRSSAQQITQRHHGGPAGPSLAVAGVDVVFHGHTPMPQPMASANTRWLDTGAFMHGPLAIAELAVAGKVWALHPASGRLETGWQWLADSD